MSERERNCSRSGRDSNPRRDRSESQGNKSREQSFDENNMLRLERKAMMSCLKTLEAKTRASPRPRHASVNSHECDVKRSSSGSETSLDHDK
ncbi:hypothetical protein KGM_201892 [Danaus plexippus plexippus]|uniref:Uncharacterized protein n=1 Tax=Danaus plexippus plexippus TaxID=278856 RepID=A0A212F7W1_DANPL|nr:hypothetical protein KGM_201892 [Danaus plexippus plexippus]